jgi:hypothetical protein
MNKKQVIFTISEHSDPQRRVINVAPMLKGIHRDEGGEEIILSIAANCVRIIAKTDGLERALERFTNVLVNHTKVTRR